MNKQMYKQIISHLYYLIFPGQYCVYNKYFSNCPDSGLLTGNIRWDDENTNNKNALKTPLPYYDNYNKNLRLAFCCSTTGSKSTPIQLPISRAFYLLPYGSAKCQLVEWMVASLEWISYDKEDTGTDYSKQVGSLPYYTLNDKRDITMYYCYYQSKWHLTSMILTKEKKIKYSHFYQSIIVYTEITQSALLISRNIW